MTVDAKIWVVGIGGIGAALGCRLARDGDVLLVDTWADHVAAIRESGLEVDYAGETLVARSPALTLDEFTQITVSPPETVILAVKSYQTPDVVRALKPLIGADTQVVSAQNGLNEDVIADHLGADRTVGAICLFDGQLVGPGRAQQRRTDGKMVIGDLGENRSQLLKAIAAQLAPAVHVEITDNIYGELWTKIIRNGMINGVCALAGADVGTAVSDEAMLKIIVALGIEGVQVARALGVTLIESDLYGAQVNDFERGFIDSASFARVADKVRSEYLGFARVIPSMAQDVAKSRRTEIEFLNGAVLARSVDAGVRAEVNEAIVAAVKRIEGSPHRPEDGRPAIGELAALVDRLTSHSA
ncbi:MAG: ketopantoate reductase family protein [Actinomycetota bacterium]